MSTHNYQACFSVERSEAETFDAITRVSEWWTGNLEGSSQKLNDVFTTYFGETTGTFKLIEVEPDKKIVWEVVDCHLHFLRDKKEWKGTTIVFDIFSGKDGTTVEMTHVGLVPGIECYENCKVGWDHYIKGSLYKLLTEGKGTPDEATVRHREKDAATRRAPRAVADTEKGMILATADVAMPPDRVFFALVDPEEIERWWGAVDVYRMTNWVADTRVGGNYSVVVKNADGNSFPASGQFLAIDKPRKLVHTRKYDWDYPVLGRRETTISYQLEPIGEGTRVTVRHEGFGDADQAAYAHAEGWERVLGWLDHYLYYQFYFPKN